jgi:transaldolase
VKNVMPEDGGDADRVLADFARAGIDETALAARLQREGTSSFDKSWADLLRLLDAKVNALSQRASATARPTMSSRSS